MQTRAQLRSSGTALGLPVLAQSGDVAAQSFLANLGAVLSGTAGFFDGFGSDAAVAGALVLAGLLSTALTAVVVAVTLGSAARDLGLLPLSVVGGLAAVLGAALTGLLGLLGLLLVVVLVWVLVEVACAARQRAS